MKLGGLARFDKKILGGKFQELRNVLYLEVLENKPKQFEKINQITNLLVNKFYDH